jgi:protein-disulfide isomerase
MSQDSATGAARRAASRQIGILLGLLAAIAAAILIAGCGSSEKATAKSSGTQAQGTGAEVASLLAGIPQREDTLGNPRAPVTLQYFADLQCPFCKRFTLGVLPLLIERYVRDGRLKIEYRSLETATRDPETFKTQQVAALAAGRQNKMWNFIDLFYHEAGQENSGYVTESYLQGLAQQVPGLNPTAWIAERNDARLTATIAGDARAANHARLASTPSFLLSRRHDVPYATAIVALLKS